MKSNTKEWIQYSSAILMILSGIFLAFLSFFFNNYNITNGILWYIAQALVYAGGIFGVSLYFRTKIGDFESRATQAKDEIVDAIALLMSQRVSQNKKNESKTKKEK